MIPMMMEKASSGMIHPQCVSSFLGMSGLPVFLYPLLCENFVIAGMEFHYVIYLTISSNSSLDIFISTMRGNLPAR